MYATLPIMYHLGKETVPIILLFGTVFTDTRDSIPLVPLPCDENDVTLLSFAASILLP